MLRKCRGFTLVEMLVAMALSLIIILAVTQVFRLVGDNVLAGRAVLEMSGQLRSAADQLQRDLGGLTVPVRPWPETSSGAGYFEYYEGPFWDLGLGSAGTAPYSETSVGDIDDVLMFTVRTSGTPFVGQIMASIDTTDPRRIYIPDPDTFPPGTSPPIPQTIESRVAEVVWFTRFNDMNANRQPDPGELTCHRRVFLVLPYLDLSDPTIRALSPLQFYSSFDISVRTTQSGPDTWDRVANSLEDLTQRENRIAHDVSGAWPTLVTVRPRPPLAPPPTFWRGFPSLFWRGLLVPQGSVATKGPDDAWGVEDADDDGNGTIDDISEAGHFGSDDLTRPIDSPLPPITPMPPLRFPKFPGRAAFAESYGSDVMLSNLLAFDVQAYDPNVTIYQAASLSDSVLPSDPGYTVGGPLPVLGQGGYVDLFYRRYVGVPVGSSLFSDEPLVRSGMQLFWPVFNGQQCYPAVYDTWSLAYEHDGIDQDGVLFGDVLGTDQGTNGIDDDTTNGNGVDDVAERETSPPYPVPLRGIQVRLRIIDRDTRQVRQMTVSSDFIPE